MFPSYPHRPAAAGGPTRPTAGTQASTRTEASEPRTAPFSTIDRLDRRFDDFREYARYTLGHSEATVRWYTSGYRAYRTFLMKRGGDVARDLFAVDDFLRHVRERGCQQSTVVNYYRGIASFFADLERRDGIPSPFRGRRAPALPTRVPKARTPDECRRILDTAASIPWRTAFERARAVALVASMIYCGLRKGEVLRLRAEHVNLAEGSVFIARGNGRAGGKDRVVYCPPELPHLLRAYVRERARLRLRPPFMFTQRTLEPTSRPVAESSRLDDSMARRLDDFSVPLAHLGRLPSNLSTSFSAARITRAKEIAAP